MGRINLLSACPAADILFEHKMQEKYQKAFAISVCIPIYMRALFPQFISCIRRFSVFCVLTRFKSYYSDADRNSIDVVCMHLLSFVNYLLNCFLHQNCVDDAQNSELLSSKYVEG